MKRVDRERGKKEEGRCLKRSQVLLEANSSLDIRILTWADDGAALGPSSRTAPLQRMMMMMMMKRKKSD